MIRAPVLAVLADGIGYHGALVAVDGAEPRVLAETHSAAASLASAVADLARRLPGPEGPAPIQAVLLSWQVHAAVLGLPVDPRRPLPAERMRELVRWELEPIAASARARRLGSILVGRGHLRPADRDRLLTAMESPLVGAPVARRLGETAVSEGLITAAQLAECLAVQQDVPDPDAALACAWRPLRGHAGEGRWRWLAVGAPEPLRAAALAACAGSGLRLLALAPAAGCARPPGGETQAVLDHQRGLLCRVRWEGGEPVDVRQTVLPGPDDPLDAALPLIDAEAERVWLTGAWSDTARAGVTAFGRPCDVLPAGAHAGMAWAAQAACTPGLPVALLPARDYHPPWWTSPARLSAAACILLTVAALAGAAWLHLRIGALEREQGSRRSHLADQRSAEARQSDLDQSEQQASQLEQELPRRQQTASQALATLAEICPAGVRLERIQVTDHGAWELGGWGTTAVSTQAFRSAVQDRFPTLRLADTGLTTRREAVGSDGARYTFLLRLEPQP